MRRVLAAAVACLMLGGCAAPQGPAAPNASSSNSTAPSTPASSSGLPTCTSLPAEAHETIERIEQGGPYPYPDNDDKRFGNYEQLLPDEPSGYYREYTVDTPGLHHRGARRIVTGGGADGDVDVWYYTADHYESFCEVNDA